MLITTLGSKISPNRQIAKVANDEAGAKSAQPAPGYPQDSVVLTSHHGRPISQDDEPSQEEWDQTTGPAAGEQEPVQVGSRTAAPVLGSIAATRARLKGLDFLKIDPFVATVASGVAAGQVEVPKRGESKITLALSQYFKKDVEVFMGTHNGPRAPMMVILPGIYGGGKGGHTATFKKMALERGMNYVVLPNSLSDESLRDAPRNHPGNPRVDALTAYETLGKLKARYPEQFQHVSVAGYSYGALHGANLVRYEEELMDRQPGMERLITGSLVSVSPPEDLSHSMRELDGLREQYEKGAGSIIGNGLKYKKQVRRLRYENFSKSELAARGPGSNITEIKISDKYGSRDDLKKMVDRVDYDFGQRKLPMNRPEFWDGSDRERDQWQREHIQILKDMTYDQFSADYMSKDSWLAQHQLTPEQMGHEYRFSKAMEIIDDTPVMVLASADDYILNASDVRALRGLEAKPGPLEAVKIFDNGGHVGVTWNPRVQESIADFAFSQPKD